MELRCQVKMQLLRRRGFGPGSTQPFFLGAPQIEKLINTHDEHLSKYRAVQYRLEEYHPSFVNLSLLMATAFKRAMSFPGSLGRVDKGDSQQR